MRDEQFLTTAHRAMLTRLIAKGRDIDILALAKKFGVRIVGPML